AIRNEHAGQRYFTDWILDRVNGLIGVHDGDIVVETSFDPRLQAIAAAAIADGLAQGRRRGADQAAFIAMTPDGAVRAMVGGADYRASQFNRATQARRQPGSAFKPIVYLTALEAGWTPSDPLADAPVTVDGWSPRNYSGTFRGSVTMREALARSLNAATVRLAREVGFTRVLATARRLGVASDLSPHPSLALGAGEVTLTELTGAYAVFANGGFGVTPYGIVAIRDADGRLLYRRGHGGATGRLIQPAHVAMMHDMLGAVLAWGTGRGAALSRPAAGKTGTSQQFRDAWFVGYTADLVAGTWVGNDANRPMDGITGGRLPATIWRAFMARAHAGIRPAPLAARY
ncbi:MAG: penicillin-binding transpeptidase domain-containing protein, partial [Alphaproteobacteria bacterium]|nr:penicillin-binding transpeptidase domain-containing protein [Alphaproteobacteria bacterium]